MGVDIGRLHGTVCGSQLREDVLPPRVKKSQMEIAKRLVLAGVPGETSSIVAAACYDQRRLSSRFYGRPRLSEADARKAVERWLAEHQAPDEYTPAPPDAVDRLVKSIF